MAMREPGGLTETDICNRAIDLAGGQRQGIIDDSSEEGSLCKLQFPFYNSPKQLIVFLY